MRTVVTFLAAAFLLMSCGASLFAQQVNAAPAGSNKKIVITKRSVDADGSEVTETIVKKGKAAENFNAEQYIRENRSDKVQVEVRTEDGDERRVNRSRSYSRSYNRSNDDDDDDDDDDDNGEVWGNKVATWGSCDNNRAFLGVEEDSDEDEDAEGLVVEIVRNSAAAKAGLKNNDMILKLNDQAINQWSDLSRFIDKAKSGDKVRIAYRRNGKDATTEATLTTRKDVKCDENAPKKGFLGVSEDDDDEDKPGVRVSITRNSGAEKAGLQDGDLLMQLNDTQLKDWEDISDFMSETTVGDKVKIIYERGGKRNTTEATLGEHQSWDWSNWNQNNNNRNWNWNNFSTSSREKPACLGVYTGAATVGETRGAQISSFTAESAAREATMQEKDLITSVNGILVKGHDDLWDEIAKYNPGDKVKVEYLRGTETRSIEATLKACKDNSSQVIINKTNEEGNNQSRRFFTWNWNDNSEKQLRESRVITIHRGEGDAAKVDPTPAPAAADRKLALQSFRAYPNPTQGQVTIEFRGEQVPTVLALFDLGGRQLFREELNAFDGSYSQQFDLTEYAKGTILVQVLQGDKVYTEQLVVN